MWPSAKTLVAISLFSLGSVVVASFLTGMFKSIDIGLGILKYGVSAWVVFETLVWTTLTVSIAATAIREIGAFRISKGLVIFYVVALWSTLNWREGLQSKTPQAFFTPEEARRIRSAKDIAEAGVLAGMVSPEDAKRMERMRIEVETAVQAGEMSSEDARKIRDVLREDLNWWRVR